MEEANTEELVEKDRAYLLEGRPWLICPWPLGLQSSGSFSLVFYPVDLVDSQPTMLLSSEHSFHFAWARQIQSCHKAESQYTSMSVVALSHRLRTA